MSCCNNYLLPVQLGSTYSRYNTNPCCEINARADIFKGFSRQLSGYATQRGADINKAIYAVRGYGRY